VTHRLTESPACLWRPVRHGPAPGALLKAAAEAPQSKPSWRSTRTSAVQAPTNRALEDWALLIFDQLCSPRAASRDPAGF